MKTLNYRVQHHANRRRSMARLYTTPSILQPRQLWHQMVPVQVWILVQTCTLSLPWCHGGNRSERPCFGPQLGYWALLHGERHMLQPCTSSLISGRAWLLRFSRRLPQDCRQYLLGYWALLHGERHMLQPCTSSLISGQAWLLRFSRRLPQDCRQYLLGPYGTLSPRRAESAWSALPGQILKVS
jgi:hypothetical protein